MILDILLANPAYKPLPLLDSIDHIVGYYRQSAISANTQGF